MKKSELKTIRQSLDPAFTITLPDENGEAPCPFVFASPHSGRIYPPGFIARSKLSARQLRSSEDAYVDELFAHVTSQGASLIKALFPRAFLDLNREPYELDPKLFATQLPPFANSKTQKVENGLGVIARYVAGRREIYDGYLSIDAALTRIKHLYFPYHAALKSLLRAAQEKHGHAILIDCHSMPSNDIPGFKHISPDFVLGDLFGASCSPLLTNMVRKKLQDMNYVVVVNKPYAGGHVTREYGQPRHGVHVLQIEINRALYLDEEHVSKTMRLGKLQASLQQLTGELIRDLPDLSLPERVAAE